MLRPARSVLAVVALVALVSACTGDSDIEGDVAQPGEAPTPTPLPDCPADTVTGPDDWPFSVSEAISPTEFVADGTHYELHGITNDVETTLVDSMEEAFPGFDVGEPAGSATVVQVEFTADIGTALLRLDNEDEDDCWDVEIVADYNSSPDPLDDPIGGGESTDETGADDPVGPDVTPTQPTETPQEDPLEDLVTVGSGQITTFRGNFALGVTVCDLANRTVEAESTEGVLTVGPGDEETTVSVRWTYDDDVVISDDDAMILHLDDGSATFVAKGENDDGPEDLIVELTC